MEHFSRRANRAWVRNWVYAGGLQPRASVAALAPAAAMDMLRSAIERGDWYGSPYPMSAEEMRHEMVAIFAQARAARTEDRLKPFCSFGIYANAA